MVVIIIKMIKKVVVMVIRPIMMAVVVLQLLIINDDATRAVETSSVSAGGYDHAQSASERSYPTSKVRNGSREWS